MSIEVRQFDHARVAASLVAAAFLSVPLMSLAEEPSISTAETALFVIDHLKNIANSQTLHYAFDKRGSLESASHDDIALTVGPSLSGNGHKVETKCSMGGQSIPIETIDSALGNPVIQCFLERDLLEMKRLTTTPNSKGGSAYFFRRRIRMALAESAEIRDIETTFNGKKVAAKEIRITPYAKDPERVRDNFKRFADKVYVFQLSDNIPGGVVKIGTIIPDSEKQGAPNLIEESLALLRTEPAGQQK